MITSRNTTTNEITITYVGRVVETREYQAHRNLSDTLDYSDWQWCMVKEALVYIGRRVDTHTWSGSNYIDPGPVALEHRFAWVDVSNHFAWRNDAIETATVDGFPHCTVHEDCASHPELGAACVAEMIADLAEWKALQALKAEHARIAAEESRAAEAARKAEIARKEPRKGRTIKVVKGRKVPVGTVGVCFWIGSSQWGDRVGLKDSKGTVHWTAASNVEAQ